MTGNGIWWAWLALFPDDPVQATNEESRNNEASKRREDPIR
jgi:hypothetical protein